MTNVILSEVLSEKLIDLTLAATTKESAIKELSGLLYQHGNIDDIDDFFEDVMLRETEGVTGLGKGVAIPHGKSESVLKTSIVIGRTSVPLEWESLDEQPVNVIILFAVKNTDANTTHIKMLQNIAICLADDTFISKLQDVTDEVEMLQLFIEREGERK